MLISPGPDREGQCFTNEPEDKQRMNDKWAPKPWYWRRTGLTRSQSRLLMVLSWSITTSTFSKKKKKIILKHLCNDLIALPSQYRLSPTTPDLPRNSKRWAQTSQGFPGSFSSKQNDTDLWNWVRMVSVLMDIIKRWLEVNKRENFIEIPSTCHTNHPFTTYNFMYVVHRIVQPASQKETL